MIRKLSLSLAAVALAATTAQAQTGTVNVEATVLAPLTLSQERPLQFGNTFPGVTRTIASTDAAASGALRISGAGTSQIAISAANMTVSLGCVSGGCTGQALSLTIAPTASVNTANATPTGATAFTLGTSAANANLVAGNLWLLIGGSITPAANQPAGVYQGTVQINASYTGN